MHTRVQLQLGAEFADQQVSERGASGVAGAVDEPEWRAATAAQFAHHRQDGRDADATGDEQELSGARVEFEIVARHTDRYAVTHLDVIGHADRAATSVGITLDPDLVVAAVGRVRA